MWRRRPERLSSALRAANHEQGSAKTFLAVESADPLHILGFYSLAPAALAYGRLPEAMRRGLARHDVPGFRLARIAITTALQGQGLGSQLLLAAGSRCLRAAAEAGGVILLIDAKSDRAATWYATRGAVPLDDTPRTLVLPLASIARALLNREDPRLAR